MVAITAIIDYPPLGFSNLGKELITIPGSGIFPVQCPDIIGFFESQNNFFSGMKSIIAALPGQDPVLRSRSYYRVLGIIVGIVGDTRALHEIRHVFFRFRAGMGIIATPQTDSHEKYEH
jgi:hypothetical protein